LKILFITRLFSGLDSSIRKGVWEPRGIPTIYKLIEKLSKDPKVDLNIIFTEKVSTGHIYKRLKFNNLNAKIIVAPFIIFPVKFGFSVSIINMLNKFLHFFVIVLNVLINRYHLIYSDRVNIEAAAFCAGTLNKKVILRLLGVYPDMKDLVYNTSKHDIKSRLLIKCYNANFKYIICTQDGSGGEYFINKVCNKNSHYEMLVNGVDEEKIDEKNIYSIKNELKLDNKFIILFVGKLTIAKGAHHFVKSVIELSKHKMNFAVIIIGEGPLRSRLQESILENHAQNRIHLLGSVSHDEIPAYYHLAHIYVSVNFLGGLSNTTLEAMKYGCCIVRLTHSSEEHIDMHTEEILPSSLNLTYDRVKPDEGLITNLDYLLSNTGEIMKYASGVKQHTNQKIWCWDERINYEVEKLFQIQRN